MFDFVYQYLKRSAWIATAFAVIAVIGGVAGLARALATIPGHNSSHLSQLALVSDPRFSEASLVRFGESFEPGALALAERYAPALPPRLANNSSVASELSYDKDPGPLPAGFRQLSHDDAAALNSKISFSNAPNPAADPFRLPAMDLVSRTRALDCLTMAVYYEAASESDDGQAAVAQVVLNRLRNPLFPKTVCGVVFEGSKLSTGCQFSFTCDGSLARIPSQVGWRRARDVAQRALNGYVLKAVGDATHYHTMWVVPYWQPSVVKLTQIGAHIFYRWPGTLGLPGAFRSQYAGNEEAPPSIAGFVGDQAAGDFAVLQAAGGPTPPPPPVIAAPVVPLQVADLTLPKAAPVITDAAAEASKITPRVSYFGSASNRNNRAPIVTHW